MILILSQDFLSSLVANHHPASRIFPFAKRDRFGQSDSFDGLVWPDERAFRVMATLGRRLPELAEVEVEVLPPVRRGVLGARVLLVVGVAADGGSDFCQPSFSRQFLLFHSSLEGRRETGKQRSIVSQL
jgi:hypothetical protein